MKKILLIILILFTCVMIVNADEITLEDIAEKMKTTEIYELFDSEENPIILKTTENSLIVSSTLSLEEGSTKLIMRMVLYLGNLMEIRIIGKMLTKHFLMLFG